MSEKLNVNGQAIELVQGDITDQCVDAIVNAANSRLAGGAGVDGAIHRRGGPSIMSETRRRYPDGCPTGSAVISAAGDLPARFVIHAVGPIWQGGDSGEPELLASTHRRGLELAVEHDCHSIAFPAISTGVYGYPVDKAAAIAIGTSAEFLDEFSKPSTIRFVLFSRDAVEAFTAALRSVKV
ncbi:MAG: O-acetyl-ADP-ribose deacetylase [Planctomycetota bacterium]|nr:O-acetyl-ADP-ribose deacetylase [Planctomycetota bacterium]